MSTARKALRGASERHAEGVPRWRGRSYLSVSVKTQKHTLALRIRRGYASLAGALRRETRNNTGGTSPRLTGCFTVKTTEVPSHHTTEPRASTGVMSRADTIG
ncbi:unnamed protein product [Pleuronectes platessa]|uniref:Uncharacterized protein n=1 Tax=Pleuronectes platessa TaxID=8262 RepID=A0A9N7UN41_PLEPL|nr:unnamed protein product [Pleuronectes platessa]